MNETSKVCHLYVFLVNNMKLRKIIQMGEKKICEKRIRRPQKSKFWKIQLTKV